ncbi:unnamed protein product [Bean golden yellow mosaic virus-[Puerto Rico-Japan]]|uniref:B component DNA, complete sequence n=1 Tax=Bean golden yellow mosaic virus (isolate Puerto Rico-Japan) TaxID=222449 RepID=Q67578_BGYMJ|nr:hypothetical protein BGYMVsAgp2 [Bean golden yellow mosaic virus]BAA00135.1 unnamed protein product [Bean golden yellow mosaic virus-[Puerto Rico-Japan]]
MPIPCVSPECLSVMRRGVIWREPPRFPVLAIILQVVEWAQNPTRPMHGSTGPCIESQGYIGCTKAQMCQRDVKDLARSNHMNNAMIYLMLVRLCVYPISHVGMVLPIVLVNVFV